MLVAYFFLLLRCCCADCALPCNSVKIEPKRIDSRDKRRVLARNDVERMNRLKFLRLRGAIDTSVWMCVCKWWFTNRTPSRMVVVLAAKPSRIYVQNHETTKTDYHCKNATHTQTKRCVVDSRFSQVKSAHQAR